MPPEVKPSLEEVRRNLVPPENAQGDAAQKKDRAAAELVKRIKDSSTTLDVSNLKAAALRSLARDIDRLAGIVEVHEERGRRIEKLRICLQNWLQDNPEVLTTAPEKLKEAPEKLKGRVGADSINQGTLNTFLDKCNKALDAHKQITNLQAGLEQANREEKFDRAASLSKELSLLKDKRDRICTQVIADFSEPLEGSLALETPQARESSDLTKLGIEDREQQKNDAGETSHLEPHEETATSLEPEAKNIPESILNKKKLGHPLPDESKNDYSREEPLDTPSEDSGESDEISPSRIERIEKGIAIALERKRFGVAYHLALARTNPDALPYSNAVKLIATNYITDETAPVSAELHSVANDLLKEAETILPRKQPSIRRNYSAPVVCAALSPALIAPDGPVVKLLRLTQSYLGDMTALQALAKSVSENRVSLSVEVLPGGSSSQEDWIVKTDAFQKEAENWIRAESQSKIRFAPATAVWHRILEEWKEERCASIGYMFKLLTESPNEINIRKVSEIAEYWRRKPESEIDRIDRSRRESSKKKIEGPSRSSLLDKIEKAISFADRWDELLKARPDKRSTFQTEQVEKLCTAVRSHGEAALKEIASLNSPIAPKSEKLVRRFIDKFSASPIEPLVSRLRLEDLLNGDLLVDPDIPCNHKERDTIEVDSLLRLAEQDKFGFDSSIIERAKRGDFRGAEATFDFADRRGSLDENSAARIRTQIEKERRRVIERLTTKIHSTNNQLDAACAQGILTADEVEQKRFNISHTDLAEDDDFKRYHMKLEEIDKAVNNGKQEHRKKMEEQLASLKNASTEEQERIQDAIQNGQFRVAEIYIELIEDKKSLPQEMEVDHVFDAFFPGFVEEYAASRDQTEDASNALLSVRSALENGERAGPVDATPLSKDARLDGARLLQIWDELRTARKITDEKLSDLISVLGFTNVRVSTQNNQLIAGETSTKLLKVKPIADRRIAQLPDFGSRAGGKYQLIVIRNRETEEAIIQGIGERKLDGQSPNIVVFLNTLDAEARRELARSLGSGDYHPTLILDEALVAFLATRHNKRLSSFFACASAFTFAQPFDPDATEVPPEMFFGREKEREKILNMDGDMTHLVYGGRRLGKTALLMDIEREYRSQSECKVVRCLSLKGKWLGESHQAGELWRIFAEHLVKHNIVPRNTIRYESLKTKIKDWLEKDKERRILFLVDEADLFLDTERKPEKPEQPYRVLEQIKRLMEETKRHFKVVFAGLHNVQRAARDPNTPFAHLGEPVRIGPMLPDPDGDEIENLIRAPLETLGYRFDSVDSVVRIAAETNYYPALVQQFCKELLRDLRENNSQSKLPYTIGPEVVDRVFDSKETRSRIRNLFAWTIQLDPRYEFLTYLIARQSFDNDTPWLRSVPIEDIRTAALREWRQGFDSDPSFWTFQILLEEMVDLGILREIRGEGFAIRTRNLRMLLGNNDEIEQRFSDAKAKSLTPIFDPSQFRHTLDDQYISSLSAGQEERLVSNKQGVGLIFGTYLAGLDRIHESFERLKEEPSVTVHGPFPTFGREARRAATRSRKPGTHIVLVDMRNSNWRLALKEIKKALELPSRLEAQNQTIRPVFICTPTHAWERLNESDSVRESNVELWEIWLGPCAKGFACAWLKEREAPAYTNLESQDTSIDTPWPAVVETAAKDKLESMAEAVDLTLNNKVLVSDILEVSEAVPVLRELSDLVGPLTADDLSDFLSSVLSLEQAERVLDWASRLGAVQRDGEGYRLDTAYAIGLKRSFKE